MGIKIANNAFSTLAASIGDSDTSLTLASGTGSRFPILLPGDYFYVTMANPANQTEIIKCTDRSGDILTVVRGQESTTRRTFSVGDKVEMRVTAQTLLDVVAEAVAAALP
jgi:hypothetical protein